MKKILFLSVLGLCGALFAELPDSIVMQAKDIKVRLDRRKRWNINRIELDGRLLSVDNPSAHYGMTFNPEGTKFFIGSGHKESGKSEDVESLKIRIDGRETAPAPQRAGKSIEVEKVSRILAFTVKYSLRLQNDTLSERTEITSAEDVKVSALYCFMHPWTTEFAKCHVIQRDGRKADFDLTSSEKFPQRNFAPAAAWYIPGQGIIAATILKLESGSVNPRRLIWDRRFYRKDYMSDFTHKVFPAGHTAVYSAKTGFAECKETEKWTAEAEKLIAELGK